MSVYNIYVFPSADKPLDAKLLENLVGDLMSREIGVLYLTEFLKDNGDYKNYSDFHIELMPRLDVPNPHIEMLWRYEKFVKLPVDLQEETWKRIKVIATEIGGAYITEGLNVSGFYQRFIDFDGVRYIDNTGFKEQYYRGIDRIHVNLKNGGNTPIHPNIKRMDTDDDWERYEMDDTIFEDTDPPKPDQVGVTFEENASAKAIIEFYVGNNQINPSKIAIDVLSEIFPLKSKEFTAEYMYSWLGLAQAQLQTGTVHQETISVIEELLIKRIENNLHNVISEKELDGLTPKMSILLHLMHQF